MKRNYVLLFLVTAFHLSGAAHAEEEHYTDPRDGERYPVVHIAGMSWLGRNLNNSAVGSYCFGDRAENCVLYGRLYQWKLALRACPPGWHLSSEDDWRRLEAHLGMKAEELELTKGRGVEIGDKLKVGGSSGLEIVFSGWRDPEGNFHEGNGNDRAAALWTSTEADADTAWHRDLSSARSVIWRSEVDKPYSLSARCVKDGNVSKPVSQRDEVR